MPIKTRKIALFSHKGGVGKTTLTVNAAWALAESGKKVLLVDADPQCSLTSYVKDEAMVDQYLDLSDEPSGRTLWSAMKPIAEAAGDYRPIKPVSTKNANIHLIPGDIRIAEFESELANFWNDCFQRKLKGFRGTTALSRCVAALSGVYDYVLFDCGPNIGPLNRTVLLDCDYFAVPVSCDVLSMRALKTLGHTMAGWVQDWRTISDLAPDGADLLSGLPKLAGYIPQRFRVYGGVIAGAQASFVPKLEKVLLADVVNVLADVDARLIATKRYQLAQVKEFPSLAAASQAERVAIWRVSKGTQDQRDEARDIFGELAANLIRVAK